MIDFFFLLFPLIPYPLFYVHPLFSHSKMMAIEEIIIERFQTFLWVTFKFLDLFLPFVLYLIGFYLRLFLFNFNISSQYCKKRSNFEHTLFPYFSRTVLIVGQDNDVDCWMYRSSNHHLLSLSTIQLQSILERIFFQKKTKKQKQNKPNQTYQKPI